MSDLAGIKCCPQIFHVFHRVTYNKPDEIPRSLSSVDAARATQYISLSRKWLGWSRADIRKRNHGGEKKRKRERKKDTGGQRRPFSFAVTVAVGQIAGRWLAEKRNSGGTEKRRRGEGEKDEKREKKSSMILTASSRRPTIVC